MRRWSFICRCEADFYIPDYVKIEGEVEGEVKGATNGTIEGLYGEIDNKQIVRKYFRSYHEIPNFMIK